MLNLTQNSLYHNMPGTDYGLKFIFDLLTQITN